MINYRGMEEGQGVVREASRRPRDGTEIKRVFNYKRLRCGRS